MIYLDSDQCVIEPFETNAENSWKVVYQYYTVFSYAQKLSNNKVYV